MTEPDYPIKFVPCGEFMPYPYQIKGAADFPMVCVSFYRSVGAWMIQVNGIKDEATTILASIQYKDHPQSNSKPESKIVTDIGARALFDSLDYIENLDFLAHAKGFDIWI